MAQAWTRAYQAARARQSNHCGSGRNRLTCRLTVSQIASGARYVRARWPIQLLLVARTRCLLWPDARDSAGGSPKRSVRSWQRGEHPAPPRLQDHSGLVRSRVLRGQQRCGLAELLVQAPTDPEAQRFPAPSTSTVCTSNLLPHTAPHQCHSEHHAHVHRPALTTGSNLRPSPLRENAMGRGQAVAVIPKPRHPDRSRLDASRNILIFQWWTA